MDIGYNSNVGLECVIASLRDEPDFLKKSEKLRNTTLRKVLKKQTLKDASNSAFNALDLVAEGITWDELRSKHSMQDIIDFGTTFAIAKSIGLKCKYYGGDNGLHILKQMNATDDQIKESVTSLQDIKEAQWSADTVKQAGFQIEDLIHLGNVKSELSQQKGWSIKEIVLAFNPTGDEWVQAGYKNEENCDAAQYKTFVQPKTATMDVDYQYKKKETKKVSAPADYIITFDENKLNRVKF